MVSFHAEKNFLGSIIRGKQIADWIGGTYRGERGDVNIYIKPTKLDDIQDGDWVDVSDGEWLFNALKKRPKIKVIAHSLRTYEILKELPNEVVWISQQHLNWERDKRDRKGITTCGYIGHPNELAFKICDEVGEKVKSIGWNWITCFDYKTREDACAFYKKIDLLVIGAWDDPPYKTPTKLINAASFGVPSVAYPTEGYKEFEGYYVPAKDLDEMAIEIQKFKNKNYYNEWSEKIIKKADEYHISNVANNYNILLK
jgi:glycosyltransferase involved in cell wall biosynthesis